MHAKVQKLINKYDTDKGHEESQSSDNQSKIFNNVAIFVNGYTGTSCIHLYYFCTRVVSWK